MPARKLKKRVVIAMLRLIMRRGPTPGAIYDLERDEITIGRGSKNTIIIRDNEVSREHCRLVRNGDDFDVHDLGSSNGTFVNGQRAVGGTRPLRPGALIELGDSITLEYERINLPILQQKSKDDTEPKADMDAPARHYVTVTKGPGLGKIFPLDDIIITVGREATSDISLPDPEVSRYHLRLRREKRGYSVEDMGSTNGTMLNDLPLTQPTLLAHHDALRLGTMVQLQYIRQGAEISDGPGEDDTGAHKPVVMTPVREQTLIASRGAGNVTRILGTGLESGILRDHIFLVYDRYDWQKVAAPLMMSLNDFGFKVWVDQYLANDTDAWRAAMNQAKRECPIMVLVVSPHSMINPVLKTVYRDFRNQNKPIIPLLYESTVPATGSLNVAKPIVFSTVEPQKSALELREAILKYRPVRG